MRSAASVLCVSRHDDVADARGWFSPDWGLCQVHLTVANMMRCKSGGSAGEYALMLSLFAVAIIGGATLLGTAVNEPYAVMSTKFTP